MAKGKASAHALKSILFQLQQAIVGWSATSHGKRFGFIADAPLPPLYQVSALRGEAILLGRFFGDVRQGTAADIPDQLWLEFWQQVIEEGGHLFNLISRIGWLDLLNQGATLPTLHPSTAKSYYCMLLDWLSIQAPHLLHLALDDYMLHLWRQQFPAQAQVSGRTQVEQSRHQLEVMLRQVYQQPVALRESFQQHEDRVLFGLYLKPIDQNDWKCLLELERPRLKSARTAAYTQAMQMLKKGN
jgi:hypothetical protein